MGLLHFDIGGMLTTHTFWFFREQVRLHPGAERFFIHMEEYVGCGHDQCAMLQMQEELAGIFEGDYNKCADFFNRLSENEGPLKDEEVKAAFAWAGYQVRTFNEITSNNPDQAKLVEYLEGLFPGSKVIKIVPPEN